MTDEAPSRAEPTWRQSPGEEISFQAASLRKIRGRDLLVRIAFGAATSAVAGSVSLAFGARVGGIFLAFPAILAASLTLIEEQEAAGQAREDARGAAVGALGLAAFAGVGVLGFSVLAAGLVLALASATWLVVSVGLYFLLWR